MERIYLLFPAFNCPFGTLYYPLYYDYYIIEYIKGGKVTAKERKKDSLKRKRNVIHHVILDVFTMF